MDFQFYYDMTADTTIPTLNAFGVFKKDVKKLTDHKNNPKAVFKTAIKLAVNK